jgi:hypothetical protein
MITGMMATVVFVRDFTTCTAFYRDTFHLSYQGSDAHSASFLLQEGEKRKGTSMNTGDQHQRSPDVGGTEE